MYFRNYYKRLSIKWKLIVILSTIILLLSTVYMLSLKVVFQVYDKQVLNISSQMLNLYTTNIENELRKIEKMTFTFFTEGSTQANLVEVNSGESSYKRYQAIEALRNKLLTASQSELFISSISYFDLDGNEYTVGSSVTPFSSDYLDKVVQRVESNSGSIAWIEPMDSDNSFVAARQIRTLGELTPIGYVIIRIHPKQLVQWVSSTWSDFRGDLMIFTTDGQSIYRDPSLSNIELDLGILQNNAYEVLSLNNHNYLLTEVNSSYTKWSYYTLVSYESIFKSVLLMRSLLIFVFIGIFLIIFVIGVRFSNSITKPIIKLSQKMRRVENGEFEFSGLTVQKEEIGDEINLLHYDFALMVDKINTLIKENYVKQLLIKESELKALQAQINPHFLYNTLESINWEARVNKQFKISSMVKALGSLLRRVTVTSDPVTTITEELQLLEAYMTIQMFRFEERLSYELITEERLSNQRIVKMSLQPIVENAIKYGLEKKSGNFRISVDIKQIVDVIEINVVDNGPGMSHELLDRVRNGTAKSSGAGIGLKNIDERIKLTFGEQYGITLNSEEGKGTIVLLRIPYQKGVDRHV